MSTIPLDLQRRFEQRWAARFLQPLPTTPQRQFDGEGQRLLPAGDARDEPGGQHILREQRLSRPIWYSRDPGDRAIDCSKEAKTITDLVGQPILRSTPTG